MFLFVIIATPGGVHSTARLPCASVQGRVQVLRAPQREDGRGSADRSPPKGSLLAREFAARPYILLAKE